MSVDRRTFLLGAAATVFTGCAGGKNDPRIGTPGTRPGRADGRDRLRVLLRADRGRQAARKRAGAGGGRGVTFSDDPSGAPAQVKQLEGVDRRPRRVQASSPSRRSTSRRSSRSRRTRCRRGIDDRQLRHAAEAPDGGDRRRPRRGGAVARDRRRRPRQARRWSSPAVDARGPAAVRPGFADAEKAIGGVVEVRRDRRGPGRRRRERVVGAALQTDPLDRARPVLERPDRDRRRERSTTRDKVYVGGLGAPSLASDVALRRRRAAVPRRGPHLRSRRRARRRPARLCAGLQARLADGAGDGAEEGLAQLAAYASVERGVKRAPGGEAAAWSAASRYVAGRSSAAALVVAEPILARGHGVSIDLFGERVRDALVADRGRRIR